MPYRGPAAAFTDLLAGQMQAFIITVPASFGYVQDRQIAGLGGDQRGAARCLAGHADDRRIRAWIRSDRLGRDLRAEGHADGIVDKLNATINAGLAIRT